MKNSNIFHFKDFSLYLVKCYFSLSFHTCSLVYYFFVSTNVRANVSSSSSNRRHGVCYVYQIWWNFRFIWSFFTDLFFSAASGQVIIHKSKIKYVSGSLPFISFIYYINTKCYIRIMYKCSNFQATVSITTNP